MGNSGEVFKEMASFIAANPQVTFAGLTPNMKGLEGAMAANCKEVAIFGAASESFSKKNINMSIDEALGKQGEVATSALASGLTVRGYVSCVVGEDAVVVKLNIRVDDTLSLLGNS
jgi:hydroxymethylglutaryl-CoA lyase